MLTTKANVHSKLLTIQQVAAMTAITPRQLRYWERYGIIKPKMVDKGKRKDRRYSLRDIALLKKALHLRKKKMSIRRLAKIIKNPNLHFDIKAFDIEQKFTKERPVIIKEALEILQEKLVGEIKKFEASMQDSSQNNDYIQLVSKLEKVRDILAEQD